MLEQARLVSHNMKYYFQVAGDGPFVNDVLNHGFWRQYTIGSVERCAEVHRGSEMIIQSPTLEIGDGFIHCDNDHIFSGIKYISLHAEAARQEVGQYTIHGSVIALGGLAVAMVGGVSGIGKTTIASTAQRQKRWEWLSDEKFEIDQGGRYLCGLGEVLNDPKSQTAASGESPVDSSKTLAPLPISSFIIPIVTGEHEATAYEYDQEKALYHFYGELTKTISAGNALLYGYDHPLQSTDNRRISAKRYEVAKYLAKHLRMVYLRGSPEKILDICEARYLS